MCIRDRLQNGYAGGDLNASHLDACYQTLQNTYDPTFGGFGQQPKFPTCHTLSFLLRYHQRTGEKNALEMVKQTLKNIRHGGIYDQVGFGIHRYSTDEKWLVPHFEKMLYDQALFTIANLETYLVTKDKFFLRSCRETLEYVIRELTSEEGGFYSAEDADSEGEEGKFYLWSMEELIEALGEKNASVYAESFQFKKKGNYLDELSHELTGNNIPHLSRSEYGKIIEDKKKHPLSEVKNSINKNDFNFKKQLNKFKEQNKIAIVAEVKKASPSKGVFVNDFDHLSIANQYLESGAACLSILTEKN